MGPNEVILAAIVGREVEQIWVWADTLRLRLNSGRFDLVTHQQGEPPLDVDMECPFEMTASTFQRRSVPNRSAQRTSPG